MSRLVFVLCLISSVALADGKKAASEPARASGDQLSEIDQERLRTLSAEQKLLDREGADLNAKITAWKKKCSAIFARYSVKEGVDKYDPDTGKIIRGVEESKSALVSPVKKAPAK